MAAHNSKSDNTTKEFTDVTLVCQDDSKIPLHKLVLASGRATTQNFTLNVVKQEQRKINDADKALMKVENNEEDIKIRPNSGCFKVISVMRP